MQQRLINIILLVTLSSVCISSFAKKTDTHLPYQFSAGSVFFNNKAHEVTFIKDVKVHQGPTQLQSNKLHINLDKNNKIINFTAYGDPAHYSTIQDPNKGRINAYGDVIYYDALRKTVTLTGHASIKQKGNQMQAAKIVYQTEQGSIRTEGTKAHPITHIAIMPQSTIK